MTTETRYLDLLNNIVGGPFYASEGNILPYRSGLTEFKIITNFVNEEFLILINNIQSGIVTTDINGVATFNLMLPLGETLLELDRKNSTNKIKAYITTREYAVWYAAIAEQLETIDDSIESTLKSFYLAEVGTVDIDLAHGVMLLYPNESVAELEAYREMLQLIRQSTRQFAGRLSGKYATIAAITQINPLIFDRYKSGPRWVLGYDAAFDNLQNYTKYATSLLTNINALGTFVVLDNSDSYNNLGNGNLYYYKIFNKFIWRPPITSSFNIENPLLYEMEEISSNGQYNIPAGRSLAYVDSLHFPITITNGEYNYLYVEIDDVGTILPINLSHNGGINGTGNLPLTTIINAYFIAYAPYNAKRKVNVAFAGSLSNYVEVVRISDGTGIGTATVTSTLPAGNLYMSYTAPGDSAGVAIPITSTGLYRLYSSNIYYYIDVYVSALLASATSDTFTINTKYGAVSSLISSSDQFRIISSNKYKINGPSSVAIHPGCGDVASFPRSTYRGGFDLPRISTILNAAVSAGATTITVPLSNDAVEFSAQSDNTVFKPFDIIIGYGYRILPASITTFNIGTVSNNTAILDISGSGQVFKIGDTHVNININPIAGTYNTVNNGRHKIIQILTTTTAIIKYGGTGCSQPGAAASPITGVSVINVDPRTTGTTGLLTFSTGPNRIAWTAPGDSIGTAVILGASTYYKLYSNNGTYIGVLISTSLLPGIGRTEILYVSNFKAITGAVGGVGIWSNGEKATVTNIAGTSPDTWTLQSPVIGTYSTNQITYPTYGQLPLKDIAEENFGGLTITVDTSKAPAANASDIVTIGGSSLPNGWLLTSGTSTFYISSDTRYNKGSLYSISSTNDAVIIEKDLEFKSEYIGVLLSLKVWVRNMETTDDVALSFSIGFDFGAGKIYSPSINVNDPDLTMRQPKLLEFSQIVPITATKLTVFIKRETFQIDFSIDRIAVIQNNMHALFLGHNTIPRSSGRSHFGSLLYVWSSDQLSQDELNLFGMGNVVSLPSGNYNGGTIISGRLLDAYNAHEELDAFDITDVVSGNIVNVRGPVTDIDWGLTNIINMDIVSRVPRRFSYIKPNIISQQNEILVVATTPPYLATLSIDSTQDQDTSILYEDDIPVPNDQWQYNTSTQIQIISGFNINAIYRLEYQALIMMETAPIDIQIPSPNGNDTWYADYMVWNRHDVNATSFRNEVAITFNVDLSAILPLRSDTNKLQSVLTENTGITKRIIPQQAWDYIDSTSIKINSSEYNASSIYTFTYNQQIPTINRVVSIISEIRSAVSIFGLSTAIYTPFNINDAIDINYRYHQIRLTLLNITNINDVRIHSATLRGLRLNTPPIAPGL